MRSPTRSASLACSSISAASAGQRDRPQTAEAARPRRRARPAERAGRREARAAPAAGRTEVLRRLLGHADEQGLLLGDDRYSYRTLRDRLDQIPADVRIAVLDACASGAFTRIKGGKARPAFLVDASANMRGHAFLTSSAATEAAQESDRIRASYFTHYLVSGVPRRRRPLGRRQGHAQRGVSVRVQRNARPHRGHEGGAAAPVVRHQPVGHRRRRDDRRAPDDARRSCSARTRRTVLRPQLRRTSWSSSCTSRAGRRSGARRRAWRLRGADRARTRSSRRRTWLKARGGARPAPVRPGRARAARAARRRRAPALAVGGATASRCAGHVACRPTRRTLRPANGPRDLFGGVQGHALPREVCVSTLRSSSGRQRAKRGASCRPRGVFAGSAAIMTSPVGLRWNPLPQGGPPTQR